MVEDQLVTQKEPVLSAEDREAERILEVEAALDMVEAHATTEESSISELLGTNTHISVTPAKSLRRLSYDSKVAAMMRGEPTKPDLTDAEKEEDDKTYKRLMAEIAQREEGKKKYKKREPKPEVFEEELDYLDEIE